MAMAMAQAACVCCASRTIPTKATAFSTQSFLCRAQLRPEPRSLKLVCAQHLDASGDADASSSMESRRSALSLLVASIAAFGLTQAAVSAPSSIKVEGPPPPFGGLPGTENADEARDLDKPLKERFFLQPLPPDQAAIRVKDSVDDIVGVKSLIDKKAWPYVQNDLRSKAQYLRFDLNTIISSKPKEEKAALKALASKLYESINNLDYAARSKSTAKAEKYYEETMAILKDVLSKIA
ncbi:hypothetical protein O6H91_22G056000 [Diphasiastrum complanatum]|uniref:Uncharacterized protein n=2 Tax=Diphasiastrum complanatum TaxID=34168 RepID=A0ACC2AEK3_DIPCM|nr:hypothetical protein O6H91_22G033600 [Diphasiastrum complanatum]KAJ7516376.1 hypothetical protein O6H91_22G056000 [Diphasiastrum complanatum]